MRITRVLDTVYETQVGWNPSTGAIKPVHIANGLFRELTHRVYDTEDVIAFTAFNAASASGNDAGFPGYGSQMDQMLYRDISFAGNSGASLTLRFKFQTVMSTGIGTTASTRTGWFDCCPLGVTGGGGALPANQRNNFISSTDATDTFAPRDSFMVYIGRGVEDSGTWADPTGTPHAVYDPQRRWFGEVLR